MIGLYDLNDAALEYKAGDPTALETLYAGLEGIIVAAVNRIAVYPLPAHLTREDLKQQSWCILADITTRWEPSGSFVAFFCASFRPNLRRWVHHDTGRIFSEDHDDVCDRMDRETRDDGGLGAVFTRDLLAPLPEVQRAAVVLGIEGFTYAQIGPMIGISRAGAHRRYTEGLATLRASMG